MSKEAVAALWANQILNKRKNFCDVPVKLKEEVCCILTQKGFVFEDIEQQKVGDN